MTATRILVVDDHEVVRAGLRTVFEDAGDLSVVGEAATAEEAVARAQTLRPDVVLMDVRLGAEGDADGIGACRAIRSDLPETQVLMFSSYGEREAVVASILSCLALAVPSLHAAESEDRSGAATQVGSPGGCFLGGTACGSDDSFCATAGTVTVGVNRDTDRVNFVYRAAPSGYDLALGGSACGSHHYFFVLSVGCTETGAALQCAYLGPFTARLTVQADGALHYHWRNCYDGCVTFDVDGHVRDA
jgi:CheY-like chemotaxis protein